MKFLTRLFADKSPPVTIPFQRVKDSLPAWENAVQDNDFTDYVFRTLGISRIRHLNATTYRILADEDRFFSLPKMHDLEETAKIYASEGVFVTAYQAGKNRGFAVLTRQDIPGIQHTHESRHVLAGFSGLVDEDGQSVRVLRLIAGNKGPDGRVKGLKNIAITPESASQTIDSISLFSMELMNGGKLDARFILNSLTNTP